MQRRSHWAQLRAACLWECEKLRLVYVGWLVVVTLGASSLEPGAFWRFTYWFSVISGAIFAILAFIAGPALRRK